MGAGGGEESGWGSGAASGGAAATAEGGGVGGGPPGGAPAAAGIARAATPWPTPTVPPTATPDPFAAAGMPTLLEMPTVGIAAPVESVGLTSDGAMDVPQDWMSVGWYAQGTRPGEVGNAVMAGHLDTSSGRPAVFWDLDKLAPGDEIAVTYANGDRYVFVVQRSQVFDHDAEGPVIQQIFAPDYTANLNLITCDGPWDGGLATYPKRLVVYTSLAVDKTVKAAPGGIYQQ